MKLINVSKIYKNKYYEIKALDNINISFDNHGLVFILGKSGSGKSTLLNMLSGIDKPTSGNIYINNDNDITTFTGAELDNYRNTYASLVFQDYNLIKELNVFDNINLVVNDKNKVLEALTRVGLIDFKDRKIYELSGGQKQRVAIARSIAMDTKVILLDEPTAALDSKNSEQILLILKQLSKEKLIIIVTHNKKLASKYNDRIIEISDGKIINDTNNISYSNNDVIESSIKPISFNSLFKLSINNLKLHPIRLLISVLLLIISLTLLGTSLNMNFINADEAYINSLYNSNAITTKINKFHSYDVNYGSFNELFFDYKNEKYQKIDNEIYSYLNEYNIAFYNSTYTQINIDKSIAEPKVIRDFFDKHPELKDRKDLYFNIEYFCDIKYDDLNDLNLYLEAGRLPENENEIAISRFVYNRYELISFTEINGTVLDIDNYEDVLNKEIIVDTHMPEIDFKNGNKKIVGIFNSNDINNVYLKNYIITSSDCVNEQFGSIEIILDNNKCKDFMRFILNYQEPIIEDGIEYTKIYKFEDNFSNEFYIAESRNNLLKNLGLTIGLCLITITIFLLLDIVTSLIFENITQYGILSALGIKKYKRFLVYYISTCIFILISFIISIITVKIFTSIINNFIVYDNIYFKELVTTNFITYLIIIAFLLLTSLIITSIPLIKLNSYTAKDILRKGELN